LSAIKLKIKKILQSTPKFYIFSDVKENDKLIAIKPKKLKLMQYYLKDEECIEVNH